MSASRASPTPSRSTGRPPAVERILAAARPQVGPGVEAAALRDIARQVQAHEREHLAAGLAGHSADELAHEVVARLGAFADPGGAGLVSVINATGVIVHTNLGRPAWPAAAIEAAGRAAAGPVLLELDRESGRRGSRYRAAEEHLIAVTGAEDALITNNNAAALVLAVGLARRGGVIVSRGELVEIGGGVRIPEIVRRAGARLIEVGTTNRTRAADFDAPLAEGRGALILRIHRSNFRQAGFVEDPDPDELAALARRWAVPLVDDLGSGALIDTAQFGLEHEPMPSERLAAGADLVTFSGDKLVGGPQAGLIVGRGDLVARLRRDPLARAMRPDKVTLVAVAATLGLYRAGRARSDIPVWRSIAADVDSLRQRADGISDRLASSGSTARIDVVATRATVGGGSLPGETLPSVALRVGHGSASRLAERLRRSDPCVIGRIEDGALLLDLRTVDPLTDEALVSAVAQVISSADPTGQA